MAARPSMWTPLLSKPGHLQRACCFEAVKENRKLFCLVWGRVGVLWVSCCQASRPFAFRHTSLVRCPSWTSFLLGRPSSGTENKVLFVGPSTQEVSLSSFFLARFGTLKRQAHILSNTYSTRDTWQLGFFGRWDSLSKVTSSANAIITLGARFPLKSTNKPNVWQCVSLSCIPTCPRGVSSMKSNTRCTTCSTRCAECRSVP